MFGNCRRFQYNLKNRSKVKQVKKQVKQNLMSSARNLIYELLHALSNDVTLKILENKEILGKSQNSKTPAETNFWH